MKPTKLEIEMLNEHQSEHEDHDDGCPDCGETVESYYHPLDQEDPLGGAYECYCTKCEWCGIR
jgi:hypothetical protein